MTALDLIRQKREGEAHSPEAIAFLVRGAVQGTIPDYQLAAWLMAVRLNGMTDSETHALTMAMAQSGRVLDLSSIPGRKVDKHSTGGVGDKVTLVVAPLVAAAGAPVAKLSGRALGHTGGTLDKLESIPGLTVDLSVDRFIEQVRRIGVAVAGQTADMVPADKILYSLRDTTATVDSVPLIASSVMSKKLAAGADAIVLDVKSGRGAFVEDVDAAEGLARALVAIGTRAGRETVAYVSSMDQPLGRAVGNALEVREAIETLSGHGPGDLEEISLSLGAEMLRLAGAGANIAKHEETLRGLLGNGRALQKFAELISAQSGDPRVCEDTGRLPKATAQLVVRATATGHVSGIDALEIGLVTKALGAGRERKEDRIDPAVGIVLEKKVGDAVRSGEPLATIHGGSSAQLDAMASRVIAAFVVEDGAQPQPLIRRRVTDSGTESLAS